MLYETDECYYLPCGSMYLRVINSFEEWLIANNHGNRLDFAERVKLEKELRILFSHPSVARADLNPMEVTERRRMARAALHTEVKARSSTKRRCQSLFLPPDGGGNLG